MKKEKSEHPYMMCTINGFDRVPDTVVLLKTEDYKQFMKYLEKAVEDNPDADILLDPDDCGECYLALEEFMRYNISAKPIRAETYEDICHAYEKEHFGFNWVLDAVLETVFNQIEASLTPEEVKWFVLRSESVSWTVEDREKRASESALIDKHAAYLAANGIRNCGAKVCELVSEHVINMPLLREQIANIEKYAEELALALE